MKKLDPKKCKYYLGNGLCAIDIKETDLLNGGYWIKCCNIADAIEEDCSDFIKKDK